MVRGGAENASGQQKASVLASHGPNADGRTTDNLSADAQSMGDVSVHIGGNLSGQLIIGNNNQTYSYSYNVAHGGVLNVAAPPTITPRTLPLNVKPRPFHQLLDRERVLPEMRQALQQDLPVELFAEAGFGKTALIRHLAHDRDLIEQFPAGVVYLPVHQQPIDDVLQSLYDTFYDVSAPFKPSYGQAQQALKDQQALIILNGLSWTTLEMERLLGAIPSGTFVLISTTRLYWQEVAAIALKGLPLPETTTLIQNELGRSLSESEAAAAKHLWQALDGNPLQIRRAAAKAKALEQENPDDDSQALILLVQSMQSSPNSSDPETALFQSSTRRLSKAQKTALSLLGAMAGIALSAEQALAITQVPETATALSQLADLHLVELSGDGYRICEDLATTVQQSFDVQPQLARAIQYFIEQSTANLDQSNSSAAMTHLLEWTQQTGQWQQSLSLARCLDQPLSMSAQWTQWQQVLNHGLQAAQQLGDRQSEAWALHQLGTQAVAVGHLAQGKSWLTQAMRYRQQIGDTAGAAISRHNLNLILPPPIAVNNSDSFLESSSVPLASGGASLRRWLVVGGVIAALLLAGTVGRALFLREPLEDSEQAIVSPTDLTESQPTLQPTPPFQEISPPENENNSESNSPSDSTQNQEEQTTLNDVFNPEQNNPISAKPEPDNQTEPGSESDTQLEVDTAVNPEERTNTSLPDNNVEPSNRSAPSTDEIDFPSTPIENTPIESTPTDEADSESNEVAAATHLPPIVSNYSFTITQGESLTVDLLAGASDPNPDDTLELYEIANTPVGGQLLDNGDGTVTYLPWEGATEEDFGAYTNTFQFVITDGNGGFAEGKLSIRVEIPQPILE